MVIMIVITAGCIFGFFLKPFVAKVLETDEFSILQIVVVTFKGSELGLLVNDRRMNYAKSKHLLLAGFAQIEKKITNYNLKFICI